MTDSSSLPSSYITANHCQSSSKFAAASPLTAHCPSPCHCKRNSHIRAQLTCLDHDHCFRGLFSIQCHAKPRLRYATRPQPPGPRPYFHKKYRLSNKACCINVRVPLLYDALSNLPQHTRVQVITLMCPWHALPSICHYRATGCCRILERFSSSACQYHPSICFIIRGKTSASYRGILMSPITYPLA